MGWSCGKWEITNGKESRCPESREEMEARKTEPAMGDCIKMTHEEWEKNENKTGIVDC